jgi:YaiO family outer membrane protein
MVLSWVVFLAPTLASQPPQPPQPNLDDMFIQAQDLAFDQQGEAARELCREILMIEPNYHEASILMARTYAWEGSFEEATNLLDLVLEKEPENMEALQAMADVKMWSAQYREAIVYIDKALINEPNNIDLLFKKAQALYELEDYTPASVLLNEILDIDPTHTGARELLDAIKTKTLRNFVGAGYRGDFFDHIDPWHLFYLEYGRRTRVMGPVIARVNYADRFGRQGFQVEADAYPTLAPGTYLYLNAGYSPDDFLFPRFRAGFEVFQMLPSDWEASLGFRLLTFTDNDLFILTGSIAKYYQQYYFSLRPYITFASTSPTSQSYFFTARRYFSGPDHHLSLIIGTGFSADEDALVGGELYDLSSNTILLQYQQKISPQFLIKAGAGYQHYSDGIWGNRYKAEFGVAYLF